MSNHTPTAPHEGRGEEKGLSPLKVISLVMVAGILIWAFAGSYIKDTVIPSAKKIITGERAHEETSFEKEVIEHLRNLCMHYDAEYIRKLELAEQAKDPNLQLVRFVFFPCNTDILYHEDENGKHPYYDPRVIEKMQEVAKTANEFRTYRIIIQGNIDQSYRGVIDISLAYELSNMRARAVAESLIKDYGLNPNMIQVRSNAYSNSLTSDPLKQSINRRVDIKVYKDLEKNLTF